MGNCESEGTMRAWQDGELPAARQKVVQGHLQTCPACRARLERLEADRGWVRDQLEQVAPPPGTVPSSDQALDRFRLRMQSKPAWKERLMTMFGLTRRQMRPALAALAVVVVVALAFTLEPVRVAAEDLLSIFRVRQFAVIPVGPDQMDKMEEIGALLEQNFFLSEPIMAQEPETQSVSTLEEASVLTGFAARAPTTVPEGFAFNGIEVSSQGSGEFQVDLALARSLFQTLGLDPSLLPDSLGEEPLAVTVPPMVTQSWRYRGRTGLVFVQSPSPTVDYPDDVDPEALGAAALQLLGMSERDARRMSQTIDWTSTLVLPIPTDIASFRETSVDGTTGLLIAQQSDRQGSQSSLLWQKDGILCFLSGNVSTETLMEIADSIRLP